MYSLIYTPPNGFTRIIQENSIEGLEISLRRICSNVLTAIDTTHTDYGFINEPQIFCFDLSNYTNDTRIIISISGINNVEKTTIEKIIRTYLENDSDNVVGYCDAIHL